MNNAASCKERVAELTGIRREDNNGQSPDSMEIRIDWQEAFVALRDEAGRMQSALLADLAVKDQVISQLQRQLEPKTERNTSNEAAASV